MIGSENPSSFDHRCGCTVQWLRICARKALIIFGYSRHILPVTRCRCPIILRRYTGCPTCCAELVSDQILCYPRIQLSDRFPGMSVTFWVIYLCHRNKAMASSREERAVENSADWKDHLQYERLIFHDLHAEFRLRCYKRRLQQTAIATPPDSSYERRVLAV